MGQQIFLQYITKKRKKLKNTQKTPPETKAKD